METSILLTTPLFGFFIKMFLCGAAGCAILSLIHMIIDLRMNPKGWKSYKEFCHTTPDELFEYNDKVDQKFAANDEESKLIPQRIPVKNNQKL